MRPFAWILLLPSSIACSSSLGEPGDRYIPAVPFAYDGRYLDGSFEGNQGFGWDTCYTRTAGLFVALATGGAPEGDRYVVLESGGCSQTCASGNPSASQLSLWFKEPPSATEAMGLYFDVMNLDATAPTGTLQLYGTDAGCQGESPLGEAQLGEMQLLSSWSTRCLTLAEPGVHTAIGLAMSGAPHKIGLDALRLGPPCH